MERAELTSEKAPDYEYKFLTTAKYLDLISAREGVQPTETIMQGDNEGMRAKYVQNTEVLIDKIRSSFEGVDGVDHPQADVVFYLDKSARPVSWLVDAFWQVFPSDTNLPKPQTFFTNLHANEGPGGARPSLEEIQEQVEKGEFDSYIETMKQVYPDMAGKNVLVVDEVSVSGSTEELAYLIFRRAFPEAHIKSAAWMQAGKRIDRAGNVFPRELPVWYRKDSFHGRGVGNVDIESSRSSSSSTQQIGAEVLSTRLDEPDLEALQLRREIKQLAQDVRSGEQSIIPYGELSDPRYQGLKIRQAPTPQSRPLYN